MVSQTSMMLRLFVLLGTALAVADRQDSHVHQPEGPENPLAYKAWSFVRGISSQLGDQAQGVLNVQSSLEAVQNNVTVETTKWNAERDTLTQEKTGLETEIARARAKQRDNLVAIDKANLLRQQVADAKVSFAVVSNQTSAETYARNVQDALNNAEVGKLQMQLLNAQTASGVASTQQFNALRANRQAVADLQAQVYALVQLLRTEKQASAVRAAQRATTQAALIKKSLAQQQDNLHLETELLSATTTALKVQQLKKEQTKLAETTKLTASRVLEGNQACDKTTEALEAKVRDVQKVQSQQKRTIAECQAADAEGQRLAAQLASCQ